MQSQLGFCEALTKKGTELISADGSLRNKIIGDSMEIANEFSKKLENFS